MKPNAIPVEILDVKGMINITRNTGNVSSIDDQSTSLIELIINAPTITNTGDVIAATPETAPTNGPKSEATMNKTATVTAVRPVRPPAATPAEDSTNAAFGLVPNIAPTVVAIESPNNALRA